MSVVSTNHTVSTRDARRAILQCFKAQRPVFMWGPPGVGKSDLVRDITQQLGGLMIDLRMPLLEPTDLRGIPYFNKDSGKMDWAPPVDLPDEDMAAQYPVVVLFLDEMNAAAPAVQASGYQLILNRQVGRYRLPDNVVIVAAGNRDGDKGVTYRMPTPLANRFVHVEIKVDFDSWNEWATRGGIHHDVVGYLNFAKADLFDFDPRSSSRSFATPRSWSFVSQFLKDNTISDSDLNTLISGTVGEGLAAKFMAHRKISSKLPNPSDVLSGRVTELETREISAIYSLAVNLCYELKDSLDKLGKKNMDQWHSQADNFFQFMMKNFTTETTVMAARAALVTHNLPIVPNKLKSFDEFHKKYGRHIMQAVNQ
jgi:hypothetical protein